MSKHLQRRPIQPEDLFRFQFISEAKLSPDGKRAVYVVTHVDAEKEEEYAALWLLSLDSGESRPLTNRLGRDQSPEWSPDGKKIAFISDRNEKMQIYIIPLDGGEASQLTELEQGVSGGVAWSPDGLWIAFMAGQQAPAIDPEKPYRVTRALYQFDGMGLVDNAIQDIYITSSLGGDPKRLTSDGCMNTGPKWSPDGKQILFSKSFAPESTIGFLPALYLVDLKGLERQLTSCETLARSYAWGLSADQVIYLGGAAGKKVTSTKPDLWVMDLRSGRVESRTASLTYTPGHTIEGDIPVVPRANLLVEDEQNAFIHVQVGGAVHLYRVALSGPEDWNPVLCGDRSIYPLGMKNGQLFYASEDALNPPDLYLNDLTGTNERRLTNLNAALLDSLELSEIENLHYSSIDGVPVEGWFFKPPYSQAPYPTILYMHGGPYGAYGQAFHFDFQMLCGAGYGVLAINFRCSSGYGDHFSTEIDWGTLDYQDLMAGVDYAIEKGLTDPDRMGCCGLSYGGYMSCWIVGHTDRFKAAVPENPISNWVSNYGTCGLGRVLEWELGGAPHENPEVYRRASPITYAHHCKTPVLLIQSEKDHICPAEQSEQFYRVLKTNGCTVEMLCFPGASHNGSIEGPVIVRKAQNEALLEWMNRFVLGSGNS